jgi:hypothetical protein
MLHIIVERKVTDLMRLLRFANILFLRKDIVGENSLFGR